MLKVFLLLLLLFSLFFTYRALVINRKNNKQLKAQFTLQAALLEVNRLLGDSLTLELPSTMQQMVEILANRLSASLVWVGVQKTMDDYVSILSVGGPRRDVIVSARIMAGSDGVDGSVSKALDSGSVQYQLLQTDPSYRAWSILDDAVFHASLCVPYRSLDGAKGVIVFFYRNPQNSFLLIIPCGRDSRMISQFIWNGVKMLLMSVVFLVTSWL
ncbi:MAG: hypothetical protein JXR24_05575 [Acidithiobacillaceae bacterium]|nr:hypothetical protein [Acidithiobacillaceae bacterium]